jgi:hypothetical protein
MKIKINYDNHIEIMKILYENSKILQKNNINFDGFSKSIQYGSGKSKEVIDISENPLIKPSKLKVIYENREYTFEQLPSKDDENNYILYSKDDETCVFIIIDNNMAEIHGIGNYKSCLNKINQNIGSHLLKLTIKMLTENKKSLGIDMITLTDNSEKRCANTTIKLPIMKILLTGDTWYGAYGFKPAKYNIDKQLIYDDIACQLYNKNKEIFLNLTVSNKKLNLINFINETKNDVLIDITKKVIESKPNMLLTILKDFDRGCIVFSKFYLQLYKKISVYNPLKQVYGLTL